MYRLFSDMVAAVYDLKTFGAPAADHDLSQQETALLII